MQTGNAGNLGDLLANSGDPHIDAYLREGYESVPGMSSRFAAGICGHLMRHQTALGISGHVAEIGTFEGRFFIAMALGLQPDEHAFGFDLFDWPDAGIFGRFAANCARHGLPPESWTALRRDSRTMPPEEFRQYLGNRRVRLFHIDGDHGLDSLAADLALATAVLHPHGLIVLDDMLHPAYPFLVVAVHRFLVDNPRWRVLAVLDREDIVAAAKFVLCDVEAVPLYEGDLMESFPERHFVLGGDAMGHHCVVLTPYPRIAEI